MKKARLLALTALGIALLTACGVKGPPLAPLPTTPEESDRQDARTVPSPTPAPTRR